MTNMRKLLALFALWRDPDWRKLSLIALAVVLIAAAGVQMDRLAVKGINGIVFADTYSAGSQTGGILEALAQLPTCSPTPSSNGGSPTNAISAKCGTIILGNSSGGAPTAYAINSPVVINSTMVRLVGLEKVSTTLQCNVSPCVEFSGANLNGSQFSPNPVMGASGGLEKVTLLGNGSTNQILLYNLDASGVTHRDVRLANNVGSGAICEEIANDANGESERIRHEGVSYDNCTIERDYTASNSGGLSSIAHQIDIQSQFTLNNGQTAIRARNFATVAFEFMSGVVNTNVPNTNSYTEVQIQNSAVIKGSFGLVTDNGAIGTLTMCSGCTSANFEVYDWGPFPTATVYLHSTQDLPIYINTTAVNANNGLCYLASTVQKGCLFLDGSNFLGFWNGTAEVFSVSNVTGGGVWLNGSSSGAVNIVPPATGGGQQNLPQGTGTIANINQAQSWSGNQTNMALITPAIGGGSTINAEYKGSGTLTYTAIGANACQEQPLTITGAASGDVCHGSPAADIGANFSYGGCRVSGSNTAQLRVCSGAGGTPSAQTWNGWARH
jgi:hypothetical protein